jgi:hypothetical protein
MSEGFIFWRRPLRVAGPNSQRDSLARLRALVQGRRFGVGTRLIGTVAGPDSAPSIRLWRKGLLAAAGDVIEFRGTLRAEGEGSAFEGELCYAFGTKFQFVGLLIMGAVLLFAGAVREFEGAARDEGMLGIGLAVAVVAAVWIYSSSRTREEQIRFIEEHLETCTGRE